MQNIMNTTKDELIEDNVTGWVKWFNASKGIGFLRCHELSSDIFIHYQNIIGDGFKVLRANNKVTFSIYKSEKGLSAKNVMITPT